MVITNLKNQVIGFCGYAGVGKDTAFRMMEKLFPQLRGHRVAFADELKADVQKCIDALKALGIDTETVEFNDKFREMWVSWGHVSRSFDPLIWVKRANPAINELKQRGWVFITDVRYYNEIVTLRREKKATIFFIDRPDHYPANEEEAASFGEIMNNAHELFDPHGGFYFKNDGTPEELGEKIKARICELFNIIITKSECAACHSVVETELKQCARCGKFVCPSCLVLDFIRNERRCKDCNKSTGV
jgi:hypothetical protein